MLHAADRFDQLRDMLDRGFHHRARLGDLVHGRRRCRLNGLRGAGDVMVGGDHLLGGLLQMAKTVRLARYAVGDVLHVARDVGELDAKAADLVGKLIDQPVAGRRHMLFGLSCRHCYGFSHVISIRAGRRYGSRPSGGL
jgi:hypothetical protein